MPHGHTNMRNTYKKARKMTSHCRYWYAEVNVTETAVEANSYFVGSLVFV